MCFINKKIENVIPYSEKFWAGFNWAQGENYIFAADLIWRRANFF